MADDESKKVKPLPPPDPNADQPRPPVGPRSDNIPFEDEPEPEGEDDLNAEN